MTDEQLYPLTDRLRCFYNGRDFSGELKVTLPTALMLEAAERITELEAEGAELKEVITSSNNGRDHIQKQTAQEILILVGNQYGWLTKAIKDRYGL